MTVNEEQMQSTQEAIDHVNATILELKDEIVLKSSRLIEMRTIVVQRDAAIVVKDATIVQLRAKIAELEAELAKPAVRRKK